MRTVSNMIGADGAMPTALVKVWDPFVRIFYWSLVSLFVLAYAADEEIERIHVAAGYAIVGFLTIRIVWGFVEPRGRPVQGTAPHRAQPGRWCHDPGTSGRAGRHVHDGLHDDHGHLLGL